MSMKANAGASKVAKSTSANKKLPLARVKKIAKMDEDVVALSNTAAIVISGAAERFAAYFAEQSFFYTLADKKKVLSYKHCASAVARLPQLDFLADVVPQTVRIAETEEWKNLASAQRKADVEQRTSEVPDWAKAQPDTMSLNGAQVKHNAAASTSNGNADIDLLLHPSTPQAPDDPGQPLSSTLSIPAPSSASRDDIDMLGI